MKYASVCSGVEAASLAWMPLGWKAAWFSEIEPFPCAVLKERFPNVPNLGDMTKIKVENLENGDQKFTSGDGTVVLVPGGVDLLVGGTPCQSFSVAGKREGLDGASGLARTFVQLLESMHPRWFVWENVPGCLSSRNKQTGIYDFNFLLAAFAEVGYCCGWRILDAQYVRVDGYPRAIPQRRRRVFVVGHLGAEWQYPAEVLFEPHSLSGNTPPRRVKGQGTATDAQRCLGTASTLRMRAGCEGGGKGALISNERSLTLAAAGNDQAVFTGNNAMNFEMWSGECVEHSPCLQHLRAGDTLTYKDAATFWNGNQYAESLTCTSDRQLMPDKARLQCVVETPIVLNDQGGSVMQVENDGNAGTLRANTHGNEQIVCQGEVISCNSKKQGMDISNELCGTLNATDYKEPQVVCYENHANDSRVKNMGNACQALTSRAGTGGGNLPLVQECYSVDRRNQTVDAELSGTLTNCGGGDNYNTVMESIAFEPGITKREGGHSRFTEGVCSTLRRDMGDNQTAVAIAENIIGRQVQNGGNGTGAQEELAYTQNASGVMGVSSSATVRRLLPVECERLMAFPDNWTQIPWKGKPAEECPDSPRYKAAGNSMCVNVMRWLGMRIELVERRLGR